MNENQIEIFSPAELIDIETLESGVMQKIKSDEDAGKYTAGRLKKLKPQIFESAKALLGANLPITYIAETLGLHFYTVETIAQLEKDYIQKAKEKIAKHAFLISQVALEKVAEGIEHMSISKPDDIYKISLTAANLAEKGNLLSGGATQRVEHVQTKSYSSAEEFDKDNWGDAPIDV